MTLRSIRLPSADSLKKLATAGGAVQLRSVALNVAFIAITKKVQGLDATGTAAAAHAVTIQLWQACYLVITPSTANIQLRAAYYPIITPSTDPLSALARRTSSP